MPKTFLALSLKTLLVTLLLTCSPTSLLAQFRSAGTLRAPSYNYNFLAATPDGNLLAATFNSMPSDSPPRELPALLIQGPTSGNPQVIELSRDTFAPQRGYSGIACDDRGFFYVSGDTGDAGTCFVRKYAANGSPVAAFGQNGIVRPNRRALGLDVFDRYLVLAVDWGVLQIYDTETGRLLHTLPQAASKPFVRDVVIDPKSLDIFGVAKGSVVAWAGGTPWEPARYAFRTITPESGELRAGEGISIDPVMNQILVTPIPGNILHEISGTGTINRVTVATAQGNAHLADSVLAFDGRTLFVSDMMGRTIHMLTRDMGSVPAAEVVYTAPAPPPPAQSAPAINWQPTYTGVVEEARRRNQPMFVYFRRSGFAQCEQFENNILLSGYFNEMGRPFVCVFEDVAKNQLLAYRFGVVRVPTVVLLDGEGKTVRSFVYNINTEEMFNTMRQMTRQP